METKTDRRIKRTRYLLVHALTSLMLKKSIKDITVKELCESVDINRGTFYLHYKDIYDMLEQTEQGLLEQFEQVFKIITRIILRIFLIRCLSKFFRSLTKTLICAVHC